MDFLSGGTSCAPDLQPAPVSPPLGQQRQDIGRQLVECGLIAKEIGLVIEKGFDNLLLQLAFFFQGKQTGELVHVRNAALAKDARQ